jgi:hypothetical protein
MTLDQVEGMLVENAVDKARGNLSAAARLLGLSRRQLSYRLSRLHENNAIQNAGDSSICSSSVFPLKKPFGTPAAAI